MKSLHNKHFPNESAAYRTARNKLIDAEIALRRQTEEVVKLRRHLPLGGKLKEDYIFSKKGGKQTKFSELFKDGKNTLVMYSILKNFLHMRKKQAGIIYR